MLAAYETCPPSPYIGASLKHGLKPLTLQAPSGDPSGHRLPTAELPCCYLHSNCAQLCTRPSSQGTKPALQEASAAPTIFTSPCYATSVLVRSMGTASSCATSSAVTLERHSSVRQQPWHRDLSVLLKRYQLCLWGFMSCDVCHRGMVTLSSSTAHAAVYGMAQTLPTKASG